MLLQLNCPCGARQPLKSSALETPTICPECNKALNFVDEDIPVIHWLLVGPRDEVAGLAVPIPLGESLRIGSDTRAWLPLRGKGIAPSQATVSVEAPERLFVENCDGARGTWIDRARIHEGVLHLNEQLLVGSYLIRLCCGEPTEPEPEAEPLAPVPTARKRARAAAVERESEEPVAVSGSDDETDIIDYSDGASPRQKLKRNLSIVVTVAALGYLLWWGWLAPRFSKDMPSTTLYRCPVDGTVFRAGWSAGSSKCPQCGALCFGNLKYKTERADGSATSQPTMGPATTQRGGG